ncbi:hypothetical protein SERLA73DRAFT_72485 [Serpula lacrymans var. lacrymans S7.3]|uniref:Uncharacterized protein n=1 Tax=Serpula lacrymans var. lacrymans (strain S7.3) TaxID=936435 RepID=F8PUG9_SERL3|nr:hypothetical protein SERLA73DRAFT_72485 [Serpula lacrymans var. lacrymans S7.3]
MSADPFLQQGNIRMDDYVTWFLALSIQGGLGNEHAVELLERNVNPRIAEQIYLQDTQSNNLALAAEEVRRVARAMELYVMHQGGRPTTKNNQSRGTPGHQTTIITLTGSSCSGCSQDRVLLWISAPSKADRCADSRATVTTVAKKDTCPEIAEMGCRPFNKKIIKGARHAN